MSAESGETMEALAPPAGEGTEALVAGLNAQFARHYVEMVVAMFVGMPIFGILFRSPLDPLGLRETMFERPYLSETLMLVAMSIPMAAYMAWRGHRTVRTIEMVAGMALPALAVIWLTSTEAVPLFSIATLTLWSHAAMLLRRDEYGSHAHHMAPGAHAGHERHEAMR